MMFQFWAPVDEIQLTVILVAVVFSVNFGLAPEITKAPIPVVSLWSRYGFLCYLLGSNPFCYCSLLSHSFITFHKNDGIPFITLHFHGCSLMAV